MKTMCYFILLLMVGFSFSANAYELATHGRLTHKAYEKSVLGAEPQFLRSLGIADPTAPLTDKYYDVSGNTVYERSKQDFEEDQNRMPAGVNPLSIQGWLMRGAIREDDAYGEGNPQDDKFNPSLRRPLHHFYDPIYNRPLDVLGAGAFDPDLHTAPAWALGTTNANVFTPPLVAESNRRNHFSVFDANEALYRALTAKTSAQTPIATDPTKEKAERNKYFATAFRALGDIVHLIEDMAQPQHTRNDQHAGKFPEYLTGHTSIYEKYLDARATGAPSYRIDGTKVTPQPLTYTGYPVPRFNQYSDYFSTREGPYGRGLADYSNRGFFSAGSNLGSNPYTSPANNASQYTYEPAAIAGLVPGNPLVRVNFLRGNVVDMNAATSSEIRLSAESAFDYFLGTNKTYSLNRFNYNDMADLLIPRAVSYAAGLINHVFRGKIEVQQALAFENPRRLQLTVKNVSGKNASNQGIGLSQGNLELYYDHIDGTRKPLTFTTGQWDLSSAPFADEEVRVFAAMLPPEADIAPAAKDAQGNANANGTDTPFTLVFKGTVGDEEGVAAFSFERDSLLAFYNNGNGHNFNPATFTLQGSPAPMLNKPWKAFSAGPPPDAGLAMQHVTYAGKGRVVATGAFYGGKDDNGTDTFYPKIYRSQSGGRTWSAAEPDTAPAPAPFGPWRHRHKEYLGGTSLVTTDGKAVYQSDDLSVNWYPKGSVGSVKGIGPLTYIGDSAGAKVLVTIAIVTAPSPHYGFAILRSTNGGQSFTQYLFTEPNALSGSLVYLGNNTLLLGVTVYVDSTTQVVKFYRSSNGGVSWSFLSNAPASPRIQQGKFWSTANPGAGTLIYLGTDGSSVNVFLSLFQSHPSYRVSIQEFFHSPDGGATWVVASPGPVVPVGVYTDPASGANYETMNRAVELLYPGDNGAIPGRYSP